MDCLYSVISRELKFSLTNSFSGTKPVVSVEISMVRKLLILKRVEVQSYQFILRNKACGLCGDLNGEKTADLKTTHQCIRSSPTLAAYSYMITDSSCQGVPSKYQ